MYSEQNDALPNTPHKWQRILNNVGIAMATLLALLLGSAAYLFWYIMDSWPRLWSYDDC